MVSTRGVKFKFSEGEKVLCYEPDPTKAKVLYDSKVLEVCVSKDSRKRKVIEYLIHFSGWSNTWDRCVSEEFILKDNDENRSLQKRLAEAAAVHLRTKKKRRRLPEMFRESLNKKKCTEVEIDDWKVSGESNTSHSAASSTVTGSEEEEDEEDDDDEEEEEEEEKLIELEIPEVLKKQLEIDFYAVKKEKKLVKLPCELNVIKILEGYVKTHATNMLCATTGKSKISKKQANVARNVNLCKEVTDGLRIYFDFTLPLVLLFEEERAQYDHFIKNYRPQHEKLEERIAQKEEPVGSCNDQRHNVVGRTSIVAPASVESTVSSPLLLSINNDEVPMSPSSELSPVSSKSVSQRASRRERLELYEYPKRVLRSSVNRLEALTKSVSTESVKNEAGGSADDNQMKPGGSKDEKVPKATRTSSARHVHSTAKSIKSTASSPLYGPSSSLSPTSAHTLDSALSQRIQAPPPLNIPSHISSMSSSSSRSGPSTPTMRTTHIEANSTLQEALSWRMIPAYVYQQIPPPPSLIYGAQHLLRLFVKLPEMIKRTNMSERKLDALLIHLTAFLNYLEIHRSDFFSMCDYEDAPEEFKFESNTTVSEADNSVIQR